jgi:transposase
VWHAAQGDVLHNDDTGMRILDVEEPDPGEGGKKGKERTGIFTSGIVSLVDGHEVTLYFTGRRHAGENLAAVLCRRATDLETPIQMCDALSRNCPEALRTILANCIAHARRNFVKLVGSFPSECRHVIECLKIVYRNDDVARERGLSKEERLRLHQAESGKVMEDLHTWLEGQFSEKRVEENSPLGDAIGYMIDHWEKLTRFLSVPGAPLDNNICERGLKLAILHRKNAYFYRTENGARVGDQLMSLIQTTRRNGGNPFEYLTALQRHADAVRERPGEWLPWNYEATLAAMGKADTS